MEKKGIHGLICVGWCSLNFSTISGGLLSTSRQKRLSFKMGGIFSVISKLIWGEQPAQRQPQLDVQPEGVKEMEQLVAQVNDLKNGEYVIDAQSCDLYLNAGFQACNSVFEGWN